MLRLTSERERHLTKVVVAACYLFTSIKLPQRGVVTACVFFFKRRLDSHFFTYSCIHFKCTETLMYAAAAHEHI